jgi:integrase
VRPFFKWCEERELIAFSPVHSLAPPKPPSKRDRKLNDEELKAFWKTTGEMEYPWDALLSIALVDCSTARRKWRQWRGLRSRVTSGPFRKVRTKNGKEHVVHLSPEALAEMPTKKGKAKLLFTTTGDTPISGYSKAKARLDTKMQELLGEESALPDWRTHDLRRTAASGMAKIGIGRTSLSASSITSVVLKVA